MASYYAIQANGGNDDLHQSKKGAQKIAEIMAEEELLLQEQLLSTPKQEVSYMFKNVNSGLYMDVADL